TCWEASSVGRSIRRGVRRTLLTCQRRPMSAASCPAESLIWCGCACWPTRWKTSAATRSSWSIYDPPGRTCAAAGRLIWCWAKSEAHGSGRHFKRRAVIGTSSAAAVDAVDALARQAEDAVEARQLHAVQIRAGVREVGEQRHVAADLHVGLPAVRAA